MSEIYSDAKAVIVNYQCDICHNGFVQCIDTNTEKDDNGEIHTTYTHRCPNCGTIEDIDDIKYPYFTFIQV